MTIETKTLGDETILSVEGRVDATTSNDLQNEIISTFQNTNKVVIDFEKVSYISSAGLRALLLGHKTAASKSGYMKLVKVDDNVMEVLEMTGFRDILTIE
jgi:anti-anti-sigma factor